MERTNFNISLTIPYTLIKLLLEQQNCSELLMLYTMYCLEIEKQKTNPIKVNSEILAEQLNWSIEKLYRIRKTLKKLQLIEEVLIYKNHQIVRRLVKVNHYTKLESLECLTQGTQTFFNNALAQAHAQGNSFSLIPKTTKKEKNEIPPTLEQVKNYCQKRNNGIDAKSFIDFYSSKGWMIGKTKMVDWQAAIRTWEKRRKENDSNSPKKKFIIDDGIKYTLCEDGQYRNSSGEVYFE